MGWSDYTTEDDTSLTSKFNFMQSLTLAYNERANFARSSQLPDVHNLTINPVDFCQLFDNYLDALIPRFGKIISGAYVPYNTSSIYTDISETRIDSRAESYKLNPIYYQLWFEQIIKVLNKLIIGVVWLDGTHDCGSGLRSESGGANSYYDPATGLYYDFTMSSVSSDDAIQMAINSSSSEFIVNTYSSNVSSNFYKEITCFFVLGPQWRGKCPARLSTEKFNKTDANIEFVTGKQIYVRWKIITTGRTRKPITAESIDFPGLFYTGSTPTSEEYRGTSICVVDEYGEIDLNPYWGSFTFPPFELDIDDSAGFVETRMDGYPDGYAMESNFEFIQGS